jgi:hypothetical protein
VFADTIFWAPRSTATSWKHIKWSQALARFKVALLHAEYATFNNHHRLIITEEKQILIIKNN